MYRAALLATAAFMGVMIGPAVQPARAALTLTAAGIADGFTLALFADQFPATGFCCGPLGIATNNVGQIVIQDYQAGVNAVFTDTLGQHYGNAVSTATFSSPSYGSAFTNSGGTIYATHDSAGGFVERLNANGSFASHLTVGGIGKGGIATNPVNGHLLVAGYGVIWDVNQTTGATTLVANADVDGVSVSSDGTVVYGATGGGVLGWTIATGALVYNSGNIGSPDGTGVIQGNNQFAGNIVTNGNDGTVHLLNALTHTDVVIATGGSRGDYVGIDLNDGSLLLTQTAEVYKLSCGANCGFASPPPPPPPPPPPSVPEPASAALLATGLLGFGTVVRRRRANRSAARNDG